MANDLLAFSLIVILEVHCYLGQSLSRLKTVTMSSHNTNLVGSHAVDGNYNRDMSSCAGTSTDNLVDQWMEIDLGETTEFTRIVVYGQTSGELPRQNLIGLAVHLDGSETSVASIKDTSQGYVNYYHFDLGQKCSARRIRLILKGSNKVLVLCEVDVFNDSIISKGKHVTSISFFRNRTPSLAVDGDMRTSPNVCSCCVVTYLDTDPWLNVDLGETFLITYIQMFGTTDGPFRHQSESFGGMNVTIDDVFIKTVPTSETCISYFDIVPIPETKGRNVRLTLTGERRWIVMCELVIYGVCTEGRYGYDCSELCGRCRQDEPCNIATGHCKECEDGYTYTDPLCKTGCPPGSYGRNCDMACGSCKDGIPCNHVNGSCEDCMKGTYVFDDKLCNKACEPHTYGYNCTGDCGNCRNGFACDSANGYCVECEDGFTNTDRRCFTSCPPGSYGRNCGMACGSCKDGIPCNHVNGSCEDCMEGTYVFDDKLCNIACEPHTYGYNCTGDCGNCRNGFACDSANGYCVECEDGFTNTDRRCFTSCPDGTFGSNCQHTCGMCACGQICDRATGECPNGCSEGYQGDACLLLTSVNEGTTISLPVYVGSMVAVACVTFAITFTIMFWRLRKTKESKSEREEAHTVREPSAAPPNDVASNYESLHLDNIRSESNYAELE